MSIQISPIDKWHQVIKTGDMKLLDELLAEEVVFHSPVVWTPQKGKYITTMYLMAAAKVLTEEHFVYTNEVTSGNHAVLEFESKIGQITINGVDMIEWNEDGKIVNFKVMVRPLKAIQAIHQKMGEMLKQMK